MLLENNITEKLKTINLYNIKKEIITKLNSNFSQKYGIYLKNNIYKCTADIQINFAKQQIILQSEDKSIPTCWYICDTNIDILKNINNIKFCGPIYFKAYTDSYIDKNPLNNIKNIECDGEFNTSNNIYNTFSLHNKNIIINKLHINNYKNLYNIITALDSDKTTNALCIININQNNYNNIFENTYINFQNADNKFLILTCYNIDTYAIDYSNLKTNANVLVFKSTDFYFESSTTYQNYNFDIYIDALLKYILKQKIIEFNLELYVRNLNLFYEKYISKYIKRFKFSLNTFEELNNNIILQIFGNIPSTIEQIILYNYVLTYNIILKKNNNNNWQLYINNY